MLKSKTHEKELLKSQILCGKSFSVLFTHQKMVKLKLSEIELLKPPIVCLSIVSIYRRGEEAVCKWKGHRRQPTSSTDNGCHGFLEKKPPNDSHDFSTAGPGHPEAEGVFLDGHGVGQGGGGRSRERAHMLVGNFKPLFLWVRELCRVKGQRRFSEQNWKFGD